MRIGEVAARAEVRIDTIRYYERLGLLGEPPRDSSSGYRVYSTEAVRVIRFIRRAQDLGFSLNEVRELLALRRGGGRKEVHSLASAKIRAIEAKVTQLESMRWALGRLLDACSCRRGRISCPILEALDDPCESAPNRPIGQQASKGGEGR